MLAIYWACLIGGLFFSVLAVLFGDLFGDHDIPHGDILHGDIGHGDAGDPGHGLDFLKPAVIVSAIATFGGAGVLLTKYSPLAGALALGVAISIAAVVAVGIYFLYIRPMRNAESSVGYSMADLVGMVGEVVTPIPEKGYGEVMLKVGAANICQIASSYENDLIASGHKVVVVQADRDTLYVTPLDQLKGD